jgi:hypothetical protein
MIHLTSIMHIKLCHNILTTYLVQVMHIKLCNELLLMIYHNLN